MQLVTNITHLKICVSSYVILLVVLGIVGIEGQLYAQEVPAILTFDRNEYNGGNKNWGFAEDEEGNLYVANTEGVLIYNGMNWQKVFLPNHRVPRCIYRGYDGRIYAGGFETIGYIDRTDPAHPVFVEIGQEILEGTEEEIWHITGNNTGVMFQSFSIIIFLDEDGLELYQPHDNIMFGHWEGDRLWVPQIRKGMFLIENGKERSILPSQFPKNAVITGFEDYGSDELVLATRNHGLFILRDSTAVPIRNPFNEQLKSDQINELIRLSSGNYAIGTIQNGVYITENFNDVKYHVKKVNGLANNTVLSLYETRRGALCIGLNIGMNVLNIQEPDLYYYDVEGKLGTVFTAVNYKDRFYVGTNQGVFKQNEDGEFTLVPGSQGQVWSLITIGDDLLCGHNSGTLEWVSEKFELVSSITGVLHMQPLNDHQLLQSTYNGLVLLEKEDGRWKIAHRISGTDKLVDRFVYDSGEVVGLHPYFGLVYYKLDLAQYRMVYRKIFQGQEINIGNNSLGLLPYHDQILVQVDTSFYKVGNYGALEKIPPSLHTKIYLENSDLKYRILKPLNNNSEQNRLIAWFPGKKLAIKTIEQGYTRQYLKSTPSHTDTFPVSLDYAMIRDKVILDPFTQPELNPDDHHIALQLRNSRDVLQETERLKYRLYPYDISWTPIPDNGYLEYKQLNRGSYTLEISQEDAAGHTLFSFTIPPHWYESWPGLLLFLLFCGVLIWFVNQRNKKRLKQEKLKMQKEKEAALEAERIKGKTEKLEHEVAYKSKMLANTAITMVQKNKMLNELKEVIKQESSRSNSVQAVKGKAIKLIDRNLNSDESWEIFDRNFAEVHEDFLERFKLTYPDITPGDLRLAAYIRMNMSSKEIAPILQISVRSVENKRYRLRKKMDLSSDTNLSEYLMRF